MWGWIFGILCGGLAFYLSVGVIMALYESSQTDDPFSFSIAILWLPKFLRWKI